MRNEIGSFYEWNEISDKTDYEHSVKQCLKHHNYYNHIEFCGCGRDAIRLALNDIEQNNPAIVKKCLLPQYTCDTVIVPFLEKEWELILYPVNLSLEAECEYFEKLLSANNPSVLLAHTYYGIDTLGNIRDIIRKYQKKGLIFIEDMTQSLELCFSHGQPDYMIGSLRKWFAIPDGGFILSKNKLSCDIKDIRHNYVDTKIKAQKLKLEYLNEETDTKDEFLNLNRESEDILCEDHNVFGISKESMNILEKTSLYPALEKRKRNGQLLLKAIKNMRHINSMIDVKEGSYLYIPVLINNRQKLQSMLKDENIFAPVLWPVSGQIKDMTYDVMYIYDNMLALPCDQRYDEHDMLRVIDVLNRYDDFIDERSGL